MGRMLTVLFATILSAGCANYQIVPDTPEVARARLQLEAAKVKAEAERIAAAIDAQRAAGHVQGNTTVIIHSTGAGCNPYYTAWCTPLPYAGIPLFAPAPAFGFGFGVNIHIRKHHR